MGQIREKKKLLEAKEKGMCFLSSMYTHMTRNGSYPNREYCVVIHNGDEIEEV